MKKIPLYSLYLYIGIAIIGLSALFSFTFTEKPQALSTVEIAYAQADPCDEDPTAEGCPCTGQDQVGTQPNCVCYNETNPACVDYNYCSEFPLSDQCNQTCSNQTYHDNHLSECGTCSDTAYEAAHPEECADPTYCCTECSSGNPSYQNTNYDSNPVDPAQCQTSACVTGTDICAVNQVQGCTDNTASNYNASATVDDGSCYWNDSCFAEQEFNISYEGVSPAVPYYGSYNISHTWNSWPVQPDTSWCAQLVASGDSEQYILDHAPELETGSSCGTDCAIANISHGNECPEGQIRNGSNVCVDAATECEYNGGIWVNADQTCHFPVASCGTAANSSPAENAPESNLCNEGTASSVTPNANTFDWTCTSTDNLLTVNCSTPTYSPSFDGTGGCGLADGHSVTTSPDEALLCASGNSLSGLVVLNGSTYNWTCIDDSTSDPSSCSAAKIMTCEGTDVICQGVCVPPGTCACPSCSGTASTTLINNFTIEPRLISASTDFCYIEWSANIPKNGENNDIGGCAINGQLVAASSTSPAAYGPNVYTLFCQTGTEFQTRIGRCGVNPSIREQ